MAGTAEIHQHATLTPTKLEALAAWLPGQEWFDGDVSDLTIVAHFRFVDPTGDVGVQTILLTSRGVVYQVPLTYRGAALAGAEAALVCEMHHSELGLRWVYDAMADPVYAAELLRTIVESDTEADVTAGEKPMTVAGSGTDVTPHPTAERISDHLLRYGRYVMHVPRKPDEFEPIGALGMLVGSFSDHDLGADLVLAELRVDDGG